MSPSRASALIVLGAGAAVLLLVSVGSGAPHVPAKMQTYYTSIRGEAPMLAARGRRAARPNAGFEFPIRCEMADSTAVPFALVRVWRKIYPGKAGVQPRLLGTWTADSAGLATVFIDTSDVGKRASYACRFMAVHPSIPGLTVSRRAAVASPRGIGAKPGWAYALTFEDSAPGVEGIIVDRDGRPIANAIVDWCSQSGAGHLTLRHRSSQNGHFAIPRDPSRSHLLVQSKLHHPRVVAVAETQTQVRVVLENRPVVAGRVLDEHGDPVSHANVTGVMYGESRVGESPRPPKERWDYWLQRYAFSESGRRDSDVRTWAYQQTVETGAAGTFSFPFPTEATARIVVKVEGYETVHRDMATRAGQADFGDVVLRRSPLADAFGTLLLPSGRPAVGAKIVFTRPPLDERQIHLGSRVTDESGRFRLDGLPEGERVVLGIRVKSHARGAAIQRLRIERGMIVQY